MSRVVAYTLDHTTSDNQAEGDELMIIASGLLWLAELIEEHSRYAKAIGMRGIYVSSSLTHDEDLWVIQA